MALIQLLIKLSMWAVSCLVTDPRVRGFCLWIWRNDTDGAQRMLIHHRAGLLFTLLEPSKTSAEGKQLEGVGGSAGENPVARSGSAALAPRRHYRQLAAGQNLGRLAVNQTATSPKVNWHAGSGRTPTVMRSAAKVAGHDLLGRPACGSIPSWPSGNRAQDD